MSSVKIYLRFPFMHIISGLTFLDKHFEFIQHLVMLRLLHFVSFGQGHGNIWEGGAKMLTCQKIRGGTGISIPLSWGAISPLGPPAPTPLLSVHAKLAGPPNIWPARGHWWRLAMFTLATEDACGTIMWDVVWHALATGCLSLVGLVLVSYHCRASLGLV